MTTPPMEYQPAPACPTKVDHVFPYDPEAVPVGYVQCAADSCYAYLIPVVPAQPHRQFNVAGKWRAADSMVDAVWQAIDEETP